MSEHYYTDEPSSAENRTAITIEFGGKEYSFITGGGVFSRERLDPGSRLLLESLPVLPAKCADIGCGWGAVGVLLAANNPKCHVTMLDINRRALALCRENALVNGAFNVTVLESDGLSALADDETFGLVVTNPPIRAGKQVVYRIFEQARAHLAPGGALYAVIRKQQGAPSAKDFLEILFGNCERVNRSGGYWVLKSTVGV